MKFLILAQNALGLARCATMNNADTIIASIKRKAVIIKDELKRPPTRLTQSQRAEEIISLCELLEKSLEANDE